MEQAQRAATIRIAATPSDPVRQAFESNLSGFEMLPRSVRNIAVNWTNYGSAFTVAAPDGRVYAVTNKHVVGGSDIVTIIVNAAVDMPNCKVAFVDEAHDIALVRIPEEGASALRTVHLSASPPRDSQQVQAAGYPSVEGEQSYRLTTGTISNASFSLNVDGRAESFIQHTAVIDRGSSGGPLFAKDSLDVVGMNTLSVSSSPNNYNAVPAREIVAAMRAAASVPDETALSTTKGALVSACRELLEEANVLGAASAHTVAIIGDEAVASLGLDAWKARYVSKAKESEDAQARYSVDMDAVKDLSTSIVDGEVLNHLRPVVLDLLYRIGTLEQGWVAATCENVIDRDFDEYPSAQRVRSNIALTSGKHFTFLWRFEQAHWRLIQIM